jgi:RHS repeat-associated protein
VGATTTTRVANYGANDNRITDMTQNGAALRSYSYDGAGNIITDVRGSEILAYTYNNRNRLASVTRNAVIHATYQYNAFEQLVSRNTSAAGGPVGTVHYIYDLEGHLIAEADSATGASVREYIWLPSTVMYNDTPAEDMGLTAANDNVPDLPLAVVNVSATPVIYQVHSDHLGRPIRMTDAAKATVWQATWKPWGEPQSITGTQANNLRFPGQYFQLETGLAYNWHRHYDPVTGRYIQPDPLRFVDGPSIYAYVGSSPFMRTDRMGLFDEGLKAVGNHLGHSDFPGAVESGGPFDYNAEDTDPMTKPDDLGNWWSGRTGRHFRSQQEVELAMNMALRACDPKFFERLMHQGQDVFVHAAKGFGPGTGHARPGFDDGPLVCLPLPGQKTCFNIPKPDTGHRFDHDSAAWKQAKAWTEKWLKLWNASCSCRK